MVRLTDLVGKRNFQKKHGAQTTTPVRRNVTDSEKCFLQASDLENLYDITVQNKQPEETVIAIRPSESVEVDAQVAHQAPQVIPEPAPVVETANEPVAEVEPPSDKLEPPPQEKYVVDRESIPRKSQPGTRNYHSRYEPSTGPVSEDKRLVEEADSIHIEILDLIDDIYTEGRENKVLTVERLIDPAMRLIEVCRSANVILRKAVRLKKGGKSLTSHSLNVAILAIKIGISREYTDEKLFCLAMCAFLGDIGMTRVDSAILNKKGRLSPEEFQEIKNHVKYSQDISKQISKKMPFLAPIVYQIHERENGNGYPEGLRGGNIHEFAKIIGMCDVYIAMTSPKSFRTDFSGYETLQQIISRRGIDFNANIIKSLIDVISVFPIESLVKLNNSAIGRVIDISPVHPTRPKLSILVDNDGEHLKTGKILDLEKEPLLYIEDPDIEEGAIL